MSVTIDNMRFKYICLKPNWPASPLSPYSTQIDLLFFKCTHIYFNLPTKLISNTWKIYTKSAKNYMNAALDGCDIKNACLLAALRSAQIQIKTSSQALQHKFIANITEFLHSRIWKLYIPEEENFTMLKTKGKLGKSPNPLTEQC